MIVTVAICTWNRAALLDRTLAHMRGLAPPGAEWELLVVNNNSTDDTDAVIAKHSSALPLRGLRETKQGLSNARNCAIDSARGELLVWTDDDVLVDANWLAAHVAAACAHPGAAYFGGPVDPWFAVEPPRWVHRHLERLGGPFAIRQFGSEVRPFAPGEAPFGANMAFRTAVLRDFRFDPQLGRIGAEMLSGEETALIDRVRESAGPGVWVGPARVRHYIPAERLTAGYVRRYFHGLGRTQARQVPPGAGRLVFGAPGWLLRRYAVARAKELALAPFRGRAWIDNLITAAVARGMLDECRAARAAGASFGVQA